MRSLYEIIIHCSATKEGQNVQRDTIYDWHTWPRDTKWYTCPRDTKNGVKYMGKEYENRSLLPEAVRNKKGRGWLDIGYHYVILIDGTIMLGRPLQKVGAHCQGNNLSTVGVCYIGGLDKDGKPKDTRTIAQKDAIQRLIWNLIKEYPSIKEVSGHNEYANKACPCFNVKTEFKFY